MDKLLSIEKAAELLGVSTGTLRRWEREGKLIPDERTAGNQRRYLLSSIQPQMKYSAKVARKTIAYARVSSHDQKLIDGVKQVVEDLEK